MASRVGTRRWSLVPVAFALLGAAAAALPPGSARADQLDAEVSDDERGYAPVQELSYETLIDASIEAGHAATLRLRVALHNASGNPRDAVLTLAMPAGAELVGVAIARDGVWRSGDDTIIATDAGPRDPGTVWARTIDPDHPGGLPAAEVIAFGIEAETTLQIELELRAFPTLRNGRWELDLPSHGPASPQLATERRVLVRGLPAGREFWVDDARSGTEPVLVTDAQDAVTAAWPARVRERGPLLARYDVTPGPAGFDDGRFRVVLRAGTEAAKTPDHVVFVIDRSRSTAPRMHRETSRVIDGLLAAMPAGTTFDAVGFARTATPLLDGSAARFAADDDAARKQLAKVLDDNVREQGTDLGAALEFATRRASKARARRPMLIVVTDGMLPASVDTASMRAQFEGAAPGRAPELVFVVDDPLFAQHGLPASHPVATAAAALGARISLESLAQVTDDEVLRLLAAPRVLGDLALELPANMVLDEAVPTGLVAGNALVLRGHYRGKPAAAVTVRGRSGGETARRKVRAHVAPAQAEAFVATLAGVLDDAAAEGFARPSWHRLRQQRAAREGVAQSGRGRELRGYLDEKIFRNYLTTRVMPRARVCYNRSLAKLPDQGGRVVLEMEVGKGEVMRAGVRDDTLVHGDAELLACLTEAAWALDVPAAKMDEKVYVVRYPLRLVAPVGHAVARIDNIDKNLLEVLLAQP